MIQCPNCGRPLDQHSVREWDTCRIAIQKGEKK